MYGPLDEASPSLVASVVPPSFSAAAVSFIVEFPSLLSAVPIAVELVPSPSVPSAVLVSLTLSESAVPFLVEFWSAVQ